MQSSTGVMFRALVMLGCLVAIPLVALCGRSLPELVNLLRAADWTGDRQAAAQETLSSEVPPGDSAGPRATPQTLSQRPGQPLPVAGETTTGAVEAVYHEQIKPPAGSVSPAPGRQGQTPPPDQIAHVQKRLQQLGAVYYLLEFYGGQRQSYRFYCRMAVHGDPNYTVEFNDTRPDPLQAMTGVLEQIDVWRRQQAASGM